MDPLEKYTEGIESARIGLLGFPKENGMIIGKDDSLRPLVKVYRRSYFCVGDYSKEI